MVPSTRLNCGRGSQRNTTKTNDDSISIETSVIAQIFQKSKQTKIKHYDEGEILL